MVTTAFLYFCMFFVLKKSCSVTEHFMWNHTESQTFDEYLNATKSTHDRYYILMGDTQYWYECTYNNPTCLAYTKCIANKTISTGNITELTETMPEQVTELLSCRHAQSEFANQLQQKSINQLNQVLERSTGKSIAGMIINGDLVMSGRKNETERLDFYWTKFFDFKIYLGLGNHDYMNNIYECTNEYCVNGILNYYLNHVIHGLNKTMDITERTLLRSNGQKKRIINGSLAYSWDECLTDDSCVHFVQLNHYPYYTVYIDTPDTVWEIDSSIDWLTMDILKNIEKPLIINFHAFDKFYNVTFTEEDKIEFRKFLSFFKNLHILAITFAHTHEQLGLKEYWCINNRSVPLVYTGSVPGNNYMMTQFTVDNGHKVEFKNVFLFHAENDDLTFVDKTSFDKTC